MQFWLTYWIVVAAITSFECLLYYVVVWVPFYYPLKLGTLMYLQLACIKLNPKLPTGSHSTRFFGHLHFLQMLTTTLGTPTKGSRMTAPNPKPTQTPQLPSGYVLVNPNDVYQAGLRLWARFKACEISPETQICGTLLIWEI